MAQKSPVSGSSYDHIRVVVRARPLSQKEMEKGVQQAVIVDEKSSAIIVEQYNLGPKKLSKPYHFDKVFSGQASQKVVFDDAVKPLVRDVLKGYSCTAFTYGQSGSGKTHTMEGNIETESEMGVIPRAASTIFENLEGHLDENSVVKVSFLELYNEELRDLLNPVDDQRLRILDDRSRELGRGVACHNLDEVLVKNLDDVIKLVRIAQSKRKAAATELNQNSSRSHCIFTMIVHMREQTSDGEELLKVGRLNLVDLAGSECVGRSGATDLRAREAGNINQSLLTLGRVINALCEKNGHIPYRDSKLTRLLQESLGGKAKTVIIANVSPTAGCLEETISTLDYASRAKNIKNKPTLNSKLSKKALLSECAEEMDRLRRELAAARSKDGVFLPEEMYETMTLSLEERAKQITELEQALEKTNQEMKEIEEMFRVTKRELQSTKTKLNETKNELDNTTKNLQVEKRLHFEAEVMVQAHSETESLLQEKAKTLIQTIEEIKPDVINLHGKIDRVMTLEEKNFNGLKTVKDSISRNIQGIITRSNELATQSQKVYSIVDTALLNLSSSSSKVSEALEHEMNGLLLMINERLDGANGRMLELKGHAQTGLQDIDNQCSKKQSDDITWIQQLRSRISSSLEAIQLAQESERQKHKELMNFFQNESQHAREAVLEYKELYKASSYAIEKSLIDVIESNQVSFTTDSESLKSTIFETISQTSNEAKLIQEAFTTQMNALLSKNFQNIQQAVELSVQNRKANENSTRTNLQKAQQSIAQTSDSCSNWCNQFIQNSETVSQSMLEMDAIARLENDQVIKLTTEMVLFSQNQLQNHETKILQDSKVFKKTQQVTATSLDMISNSFTNDFLNETKQLVESSVSTILGSEHERVNQSKQEIQSIQAVTKSLSDSWKNNSNQTLQEVSNLQEPFNRFLNAEYQRPVKTGQTPARKPYPYDAFVPQTSPKERVLQRKFLPTSVHVNTESSSTANHRMNYSENSSGMEDALSPPDDFQDLDSSSHEENLSNNDVDDDNDEDDHGSILSSQSVSTADIFKAAIVSSSQASTVTVSSPVAVKAYNSARYLVQKENNAPVTYQKSVITQPPGSVSKIPSAAQRSRRKKDSLLN